jgi:hypothetical protein
VKLTFWRFGVPRNKRRAQASLFVDDPEYQHPAYLYLHLHSTSLLTFPAASSAKDLIAAKEHKEKLQHPLLSEISASQLPSQGLFLLFFAFLVLVEVRILAESEDFSPFTFHRSPFTGLFGCGY